MKINRKFLFGLATLTPIIPITTLISCGTTTSLTSEEATRQQLLERYPYNPREVKIVVPDELFPGVKQDPVKYDQIKENLLKYKESYDQDGNYLLENDSYIFKFDKEVFEGEHSIPNTNYAKEIFKKSMSQINDIFMTNLNKRTIEFTKHFTNGTHGGETYSETNAKVKINGTTSTIMTIVHEAVHMQQKSIRSLYQNDKSEHVYEKLIRDEIKELNYPKITAWINSVMDSMHIYSSYQSLKTMVHDYENLYTIRPIDFLKELISKDSYVTGILTKYRLSNWQKVIGPVSFGDSITHALWESWEAEFFAYLNEIFTSVLSVSDAYNDIVNTQLFSLQTLFGVNFFDITKPTQAYDIMKPFIEGSYRVSKKPLVKWTGAKLSILGAGFPQLNELDHFKVFHNGNEIYKNSFVKKDVAIGFNRNPFTPNEYKYVTQSVDNQFDLGAPLANSLQLNKTNTELKFYDANDKEINLDFEEST